MTELGYKKDYTLWPQFNCKSVTKCEGSDRLEDDFTAQIFCDMAEQDESYTVPSRTSATP